MDAKTSAMIMHSTYFKLKDGSSADTRESYMGACREYLSTSKGMTSFWVGERAEEMQRPVNDRDFDVAMHQVFQNKQAFQRYNGEDPGHEQFVMEVDRWAPGTTRRVLDSVLSHLCIGDANSSGLQEVAADGSLPVRLMHSIYFSLTDMSADSRAGFRDICLELLSGHDGECVFAIGTCANPLGRDINVENFDVAVDIEWTGKEFYDRYLHSQSHKDFFPATKGMIKDTFVFDSDLRYEKNDRVYTQI